MIVSFGNRVAQDIFEGRAPHRFPNDLLRRAAAKLRAINAATKLVALALPGNHLEALRGDRVGQRSVRVNRQWRICFV